jgi:hypothetical protein
MAQAARQEKAETGSDIVRRLVARPLRVSVWDAQDTATVIALVPAVSEDDDQDEPDEVSTADLLRLKTEVTLMKAVLKAERSENASLRALIEKVDDPATSRDDARLVRDRWAILVDQLLRQRR